MKTIKKIRINNFKGMINMIEEGETLIKKIQRILPLALPLAFLSPSPAVQSRLLVLLRSFYDTRECSAAIRSYPSLSRPMLPVKDSA